MRPIMSFNYWSIPPKGLANWAPWVEYSDAFTPEECEQITSIYKADRAAEVKRKNNDQGLQLDRRDSKINWIEVNSQSEWIYSRIAYFASECNTFRYQMKLDGFTDQIQFTEYAPGQHYDWHLDLGPHPTSGRKLSCVLNLTNPEMYQGGGTEIMYNKDPELMSKSQGSLSFFPSYMLHRALPVKLGYRHTLVAWIGGDHFV
ncbi:MAG: 2OG-Fe(II) oxygenase [Proteobacteria bacterium]|nr:2OG-Fe(II) oxygenase [Pseudomonadota bacterium]